MDHYIIDKDHNIFPCPDLVTWGKWFQTADRCVASTTRGEVTISTVFLGMDHGISPDVYGQSGNLRPVLFETLVFGGEHDGYMCRCCTWDEAVAQHNGVVRYLFGCWDEAKLDPEFSLEEIHRAEGLIGGYQKG